MTMTAPLQPMFFQKKLLLAKVEAVYGTDALPTGTTNAMVTKGLKISPLKSKTESRDIDRPFFGNSETLITSTWVECEFEVELVGSGAAGTAPAWGCLLRGCGFSETVTAATKTVYALTSVLGDSLTFYIQIGGIKHAVVGARGDVSLTANAGTIGHFSFKFTGLFGPISDAVMPMVDMSKWEQPQAINTANTKISLFGEVGLGLAECGIKLANDVTYRELVNVQDVLITGRKPAGDLTFQAGPVANKDWYALARAGTLGPMQIIQGSAAGYKVQIDAPAVQIVDPDYVDKDKVLFIKANTTLNPKTGDDELLITCL